MCSTVAADSAVSRESLAGPDGVRTKSQPTTGQIVPTLSERNDFIFFVGIFRLAIWPPWGVTPPLLTQRAKLAREANQG